MVYKIDLSYFNIYISMMNDILISSVHCMADWWLILYVNLIGP